MYFEKCVDGVCWTQIAPEVLRAELKAAYNNPDEVIDLIMLQDAVAKTATAEYRKFVPIEVVDWAKILPR